MNLDQLRNLLTLAKTLHFTETAKKVNIVQPALSKQLQQLEDRLGASLFLRSKRTVSLTPAGKYFFEQVERLLHQWDRVVEKTQHLQKGTQSALRIGFTHSVMQSLLPDILEGLKKLRPEVPTFLKEINNNDQYQALLRQELDIGFATNPVVPRGLSWKKLYTDNFVVLLPLAHPVTATNYSDFSVFAQDAFIFPPLSDGSDYIHVLESICMDAGFRPKISHETGSASTSFKLVEKGLGICIEPKISVKGLQLPLRIIELHNIPQKAELIMIWNDRFAEDFPDLLDYLCSKATNPQP